METDKMQEILKYYMDYEIHNIIDSAKIEKENLR